MEHYVNIMLDSGFKAALYDEREVMQFLLYLIQSEVIYLTVNRLTRIRVRCGQRIRN